MAITRWDSTPEMFPLREAMNYLFEASQVRPGGLFGATSAIPLDVYTDADNYVVEVALPGLTPNAVNVEVLGNQVTISGEYPAAPEGRRYLFRERTAGRMERTVPFPSEVDAAKAEARYEHGVLRLTAPKAEHTKPKRLALSSTR